jgi:hypothetical protein|tara:strand:+ start:872 stop:1105 length:234 start_codon:yes stop_codon:yes gene_type:complete
MRPTETKVAKFNVRFSDPDVVDIWSETEQGIWVSEHASTVAYHIEINTETQQFDTIIQAVFDSETYVKYRLMWPNEV